MAARTAGRRAHHLCRHRQGEPAAVLLPAHTPPGRAGALCRVVPEFDRRHGGPAQHRVTPAMNRAISVAEKAAPGRAVQFLRNCALLAASIAAGLLLAEVALRLVSPRRPGTFLG